MKIESRAITVFPPRRRNRWAKMLLAAAAYMLGMFLLGMASK